MTERRRSAVSRSETSFTIGPSSLEWDGYALTIRIDETTVPLPSRLRGTVRVHALGTEHADVSARCGGPPSLVADRAVLRGSRSTCEQPRLRWLGDGYFDINHGDAPLERDFSGWEWSRANTRKGAVISYDTRARDGASTRLALRFDRSGAVEMIEPFAARRPAADAMAHSALRTWRRRASRHR